MLSPLRPEQAFERLQNICARAEISTGEARQKLYRMGITGAQAQEMIRRLVEARFIDDVRFAGAFVREKVKFARWSMGKVRQALVAKGVGRDIITAAMAEIAPEDEEANLLRMLEVAVSNCPERLTHPTLRKKLFAAAVRRGFRPAAVAAALRTLTQP